MSTLASDGPNAEQIEYWNQQAGPRWAAAQAGLDAMLGPIGERALALAAVAPGESVLDVGCGCGTTSLELARRVGPSGSVEGIDISTVMLDVARRNASAAGVGNARFTNADAQTHRFAEHNLDLVFSRFGVMFFVDPRAAFTNLRRALRPGGRVVFACWQAVAQNPWILVALGAIAQLVPLPPPPAPDAPGPFSFADPTRVTSILEGAGFADVECSALNAPLQLGGGNTMDEAVTFLSQLGPAAAALRDVDAATRARVEAALRDVLAPYHGPDGVRMDSAAWLVRAYSR